MPRIPCNNTNKNKLTHMLDIVCYNLICVERHSIAEDHSAFYSWAH